MCALERVSQSYPSPSDLLLCCPLLSSPIARFPPLSPSPAHPRPAPCESLFHSGSPLSPRSHPRFHLSPAFSPVSTSSPTLFLVLPRYVETEGTVHALHTCSHVHAAPRFLLVAANTLRQRGRSLLIWRRAGREGGGGGGVSARTAEEIRFYPAAVAETFFPYLGITSKLE